jgi:hypothetical protein
VLCGEGAAVDLVMSVAIDEKAEFQLAFLMI